MKYFAALALVACTSLSIAPTHSEAPPKGDGFAEAVAKAEKLFADGSYALAHDAYEAARKLATEAGDVQWVAFRLADTQWRAQAATKQSDASELDAARRALEDSIRDIDRADERSDFFAAVKESLGDFFWTRRDSQDWGNAWPHYQAALQWWASSTDLARARERYLGIVWKTVTPQGIGGWQHGWNVYTPDDVIENALAIAEERGDRARAHVLRASSLESRGGDWRSLTRIPREYEAALEGGKSQPWYDDALFAYAQWLENRGRVSRAKDGGWLQTPDYVAALNIYQRITEEYAEGETRYWRDAKNRAEEIVKPSLSVSVTNVFLPDSEVGFDLAWRNVRSVEFALYAVDLVRDEKFVGEVGSNGFCEALDVAGRDPALRWTRDTDDDGTHKPGAAQVRIDKPLAPGAYLLEATASGKRARELVLVSDASVILETSRTKTIVWMTSALTSKPIADADVALWDRRYDGSKWVWRQRTAKTSAVGLAEFVSTEAGHRELFACARAGTSQAFVLSNAYDYGRRGDGWRIQATTDRPSYRPEDTVRWKFTARRFSEEQYSTPAGEKLAYSIRDPQGGEVSQGVVTLNSFGSAWGELTLKPNSPLGEYRVMFDEAKTRESSGARLGQTTLFRLEEYKLPEFLVRVETPEVNGRRRTFRSDEEIESVVVASYYSGGPVANATVHVVVQANPFWRHWSPPREFGWYDDREQFDSWRYNGGQTVLDTTLTTDGEGRVHVKFVPALQGGLQDTDYRIEARVTDASRREVSGQGHVRVTLQSYYVDANARHNLYRSGDKVEIDFKVQDANDQPVAAEGVINVYRQRWYRIWRDVNGRELTDDEFNLLAADAQRSCAVARDGYERELITTASARSNDKGDAYFSFTAQREGCFEVVWSSSDVDGAPIEGQTSVWVASENSKDLGWRRGELEILLDRDTLRAGENATVLLSSSKGAGWVLFTVESEELLSWQVVEMNGPVKLVRVPLDQRHIPNVFFSAWTVRDGEVWTDTERVLVPPVEQFLDVVVTPDKTQVRPGAESTWKIAVHGRDGEPVQAELSLGVIDESVLAIQGDYALDPRQFFYGEQRERRVNVGATAQSKRYARMVLDEHGQLVERRVAYRGPGDGGPPGQVGEQSQLAAHFGVGAEGRSAGASGFLGKKSESRRELKDRASAPAAELDFVDADSRERRLDGAPNQPNENVVVRSDFRTTAFWQPDIATGADGTASVSLHYSEALTRWKASARAATTTSRFGIGSGSARTDLPLTVRLQAPRFFVVGDRCTISAVIDNHTEHPLSLAADLLAEGLVLDGAVQRKLEIAASAQLRVDWPVRVEAAGNAKLRTTVRATGGDEVLSDAMEKTYPVLEHGIDQLVAKSGKLPDGSGTITIDLPEARKPGTTRVTVQIAPSTAVTMLDALPYLIDYPYGCTEQTMSRFLPAAIVANTLREQGLDPEVAMTRVFGGVQAEFAAQTHRGGKQSLALLGDIEAQSLQRLYDFQHADGGWGWWKQGESDPFMTAYVVWGMELARQARVEVHADALERGADFLAKRLVEAEEQPDLQAWMLHALAVHLDALDKPVKNDFALKAADNLWAKRDALNAYTRALFALACKHMSQDERARTLVANLANGATIDRNPDVSIVRRGAQTSHAAVQATAHWGNDGLCWRWSDGAVETTATVLRALLAIEPDHELVGPTANWLVRNRRGAQWSNTRDTASAVLALSSYLKVSGELATKLDYELKVNGASVAKRSVDPANALSAPSRFEVDAALIKSGSNQIEITRTAGEGALYFAVEARFFSREEPIQPAGNELFVRREYFVITPHKTLLDGFVYVKEPLQPGVVVPSGARIETVVSLEAKNDLEYVMLEDLKPAGLEAVELKSGGDVWARELRRDAQAARMQGVTKPGASEDATGRQRWVHQELRDSKVALFLDKVPQGVWEIRYEMRAEVPGEFHALPLCGQAMYVPEIRANDMEQRLSVR
jgi:uncharacterized protein YfaS (alpha-2-macroglobulin family)